MESVRWVAAEPRWVAAEPRWVVPVAASPVGLVEPRWVVPVAASPVGLVGPRWVVPVAASPVGLVGPRWVVLVAASPVGLVGLRWVVVEPRWVAAVELPVSGSRRQVAARFRWAAEAADLPVPVLDSVAEAFSLRSVTIP